jgi:hypothetical protein
VRKHVIPYYDGEDSTIPAGVFAKCLEIQYPFMMVKTVLFQGKKIKILKVFVGDSDLLEGALYSY